MAIATDNLPDRDHSYLEIENTEDLCSLNYDVVCQETDSL